MSVNTTHQHKDLRVTEAKWETLAVLRKRWHKVDMPTPYDRETIGVVCHGSDGGKIYIGIEADGYPHS